MSLQVSPLMDRNLQGGMTRSQVSVCHTLHGLACMLHPGCCATEQHCLLSKVKQSIHLAALLQLGFYNIVGLPMFKAMAELFKGTQPLLDGALANYRHWEAGTATADLS